MPRGKNAYTDYISREMAAHRPSTLAEARAVMQQAAKNWHSGMPVRSNPSGGGLVRTAIVIGLVYLGYRALKKQQPASEAAAK